MVRTYLLITIIVFSALTGGYLTKLYWSNKYNSLIVDLQKAQKENMQHVLDVERLQREKSDEVAARVVAEATAREAKARVITKEVVKYVENNSNARCQLDNDWVHISNAATPVPRVTETAAAVNGTGEEIRDLGFALGVITTNYNACQDAVDRLQAWQEWYQSVSEK